MNYTPKITKMLQLLMALHLPVNHSCSIPTPVPLLLTPELSIILLQSAMELCLLPLTLGPVQIAALLPTT